MMDRALNGKQRKRAIFGGLGLLAGAVGVLAWRRLSTRRRMPGLSVWQRMLAEKRGVAEGAALAARVQARYDDLYAWRPRFAHYALRQHLEQIILPSLALYQALQEEANSREALEREVERLLAATFVGRRNLMSFVSRLPDPFSALREIIRWAWPLGFPPGGWEIEWLEDSERCLAFNVHRCFYASVLAAYGAPELTKLCCDLDDRLFQALPPSITWERTKTLGRGDDLCDFRWCRSADPDAGAA